MFKNHNFVDLEDIDLLLSTLTRLKKVNGDLTNDYAWLDDRR